MAPREDDARESPTNRLIDAASPYLLQHARNPVKWQPWDDQALAQARDENKPIFLSIGYAACHWCHVMEKESFENEDTATILNRHFVSIKVDREERPDLDEIYMSAVQLMTGSGGWPMSVFLTPDGKPFYGGTYYPPEDAYGRPGFKTVLNAIVDAWENRHSDLLASADKLTDYVRQSTRQEATEECALDSSLLDGAVRELARAFDASQGGFSQAPKFPSPHAIELLFRQYRHSGQEQLRDMALFTLRRMARGGLYDHLGGGFHRYSVDAQWLVPHFEKMLYDNAQLAEVYLDAYQVTALEEFGEIVDETFEYVLRDMQHPDGGFYSTEDADSEGEEGKFYLWSRQEIVDALGEEDAEVFCAYYDVRTGGNFSSHETYHANQNILHMPRPPEYVATALGLPLDELEARVAEMREALRKRRDRRVRPGLDDKVLTSWNALMIGALAKGYQVLGNETYRAGAERAADFVTTRMRQRGQLYHSWRNGRLGVPGFLDDYAFLAVALLDLYEATFDMRWLAEADNLAEAVLRDFEDRDNGGFYFRPHHAGDLIVRTKPSFDGAEPSGNAVAVRALLRLAKFTGKREYYVSAERALRGAAANMASAPRGYLKMLCALDFYLDTPREIAIAGALHSDRVAEFLRALHRCFLPNKIVAQIDPHSGDSDAVEERIPLLADKELVNGAAAVYICRDFACRKPVTSADAMLEELGVKPGK